MHHALRLEEVLLNIFGHCYPSSPISRQHVHRATAASDLASLARTCRTFKEPALDVLWTELNTMSPLARCLPEASHRLYTESPWYSFSRPLNQTEWDILRSYARRVRSILEFTRGLNWKSIRILFNPPTPDPMFPNLRVLRWEFLRETLPLIHHMTVPSLTSLDIDFVFGDGSPLHSFPQSLGDLCPNIRRFRAHIRRPQIGFDETMSDLIRHWTNLQVLYCRYISLDIDTLSHLSRSSSLTSLSFTLSTVVTDHVTSSPSTLIFSKLRDLEISAQSLETISRLLPHIRSPMVGSLTAYINSRPSRHVLRSYLTGVEKICTCHSLFSLKLIQTESSNDTNYGVERYRFTVEDIRPCMVFDHLRHLNIDTALVVDLSDDDLLELAPAWPHMEHLLINEGWGWKTRGGITPNGLLQLLEQLESLHRFCLAIDTRGYTGIPPAFAPTRAIGLTPRISLSINVADSVIRPERVSGMAAFFGEVIQQYANVSFRYWNASAMAGRSDAEIMRKLWEDVFVKAQRRVRTHPQNAPTVFKTKT